MNILVINGSPKGEKSNTLQLTRAFCDGLADPAHSTVEILPVYKMDIKDCAGCFTCWSRTPGVCCIKDDMSGVIEKLCRADVIIWSFPLYYYSLPSRLKALMDRMLPMLLPFMSRESGSGAHPSRYGTSGKRCVLISTCGFYTAEGNYRAVEEQFQKIYGSDGFTSIFCGQGELFSVPALRQRTSRYLETVKTAGTEFRSGAVSEKTRERLSELLYPRDVFEQMADASWEIQASEGEPAQSGDGGALPFTRQMAALYNCSAWDGKNRVLEIHYTDVDKTYQISLKKDGQSLLTENFLPFTTRIETPLSLWRQIADGVVSGEQALFEHRYAVTGEFDLMLRWNEFFGSPSAAQEKEPPGTDKKKTSMSLMLIPWIVLWVLLSMDPIMGGVIVILTAAGLPLAFLKWKATVFEYITILITTAVGLLSVLEYPVQILLPASYGLFGIMWMATVFQKYPLTAYYSMDQYNGEQALGNPLFIRTNRILTALWGILYLITPVWTWFILQTEASIFTGAVNSILPALLGIFTAWFQKWYPEVYARRRVS